MNTIINQFQKALQPYSEIQKGMKAYQEIMKALTPVTEMQKSIQIMNSLHKVVIKLPENPFIKHAALMQEVEKKLHKHIKSTPEHLLLIAEHGWFIDLDCDIPFPYQIAELIKSGNTTEADELLIEYFSQNFNTLFSALKNRHPNRAQLFNELRLNFEDARYSSFITLAFTEIDGICFDVTKKKFFIRNKKTRLPEVTEKLVTAEDSISNIYLSPITHQTPIMANEASIHKYFCKLNRHEIMHGISTNYGTRANALKVLSLLKYLSDMLMHVEK